MIDDIDLIREYALSQQENDIPEALTTFAKAMGHGSDEITFISLYDHEMDITFEWSSGSYKNQQPYYSVPLHIFEESNVFNAVKLWQAKNKYNNYKQRLEEAKYNVSFYTAGLQVLEHDITCLNNLLGKT